MAMTGEGVVRVRRERPWLARLILWSGLTERGTCCVLCKITLTVLATMLALCASRDWAAASWIMIIGMTLDVARESLDRLLGRPRVQRLRDADTWTANAAFIRRQRLLVCATLIPPFIFLQAFGMVYPWSLSLQGQALSGVFRLVANIAPDISSVIQSAPRLDGSLGVQISPERAAVVNSFASISLLFAAIITVLGVTFIARSQALLNALFARKNGSKTFSDKAVILALYIFLLVLEALLIFAFHRIDALVCVGAAAKLCHRNSGSLSEYSGMLSMLIILNVHLQSMIENGCFERGGQQCPEPSKRQSDGY